MVSHWPGLQYHWNSVTGSSHHGGATAVRIVWVYRAALWTHRADTLSHGTHFKLVHITRSNQVPLDILSTSPRLDVPRGSMLHWIPCQSISAKVGWHLSTRLNSALVSVCVNSCDKNVIIVVLQSCLTSYPKNPTTCELNYSFMFQSHANDLGSSDFS